MKIILFLSITIFAFSCSSNNYNKPFVNTDETTQLDFGLTTNEVMGIMGKPLYVHSGGNNKVIYVYEVRTIMVQSDITKQQPNKNHNNTKHGSPVHDLKLTFEGDKLVAWGDM